LTRESYKQIGDFVSEFFAARINTASPDLLDSFFENVPAIANSFMVREELVRRGIFERLRTRKVSLSDGIIHRVQVDGYKRSNLGKKIRHGWVYERPGAVQDSSLYAEDPTDTS
jgi:hypothetical protein